MGLVGRPTQTFRTPKTKFSNGIFMLSLKQYLTSILYNNFIKKSILFTFNMIFFLENAKVITNFTTN